jgi:hypothetical protein
MKLVGLAHRAATAAGTEHGEHQRPPALVREAAFGEGSLTRDGVGDGEEGHGAPVVIVEASYLEFSWKYTKTCGNFISKMAAKMKCILHENQCIFSYDKEMRMP